MCSIQPHEIEHGAPGHTCLTGCAGTYHKAIRERRMSKLTQLNKIYEQMVLEEEESHEDSDNEHHSASDEAHGGSGSEDAEEHHQRQDNKRKNSSSLKNSVENLRRASLICPSILTSSKISELVSDLESKDQRRRSPSIGAEKPVGFDSSRRRSSLARILTPAGPDAIEGTYSLVSSRDFDKFLEAVGTGPLSRNMVMRAKYQISIVQTPDKQWQITTETAIKAKSVVGYSTCNRKLTQNKFREGDPKPEVLDDWDQRLVVTTISREADGTRLVLDQIAEKDQKWKSDSKLVYSIDREADPDLMTATITINDITAVREFRRVGKQQGLLPVPGNMGRRHSII